MADWWKKIFGKGRKRGDDGERPVAPAGAPAKATWLRADDAGNPFGVELLDLMVTQQLIATSSDRVVAERAMSWGGATGVELDIALALERAAVECSIRLPLDGALPDGLLFTPTSMDQKWVIAWRQGRIIAARSWTGTVDAVADARIDGATLVIERIRAVEDSVLVLYGALPQTFEWLLRSHALHQKLPFPAHEAGASTFENVPISAFSAFGKVIFCAARSWQPASPSLPLRSDGRIIRAARSGKPDEIERAHAAGEDLDARGTFGGYTALHVAVMRNDASLIDRLVGLGADPNRRADKGMFTLGIAIVHKAELDVFAALERAGVDLLAANDDGFNALHAACEIGNVWAMRWLAERGHGLEPRTKRGHTPLQIACGVGHLEAVQAMVELGADVSAPSPDGVALEIATREGKRDVAAWLAERGA
ncbi:MAG: ankyrin repeat domain-containing protein [Deltaproteobacteria bacterium]|nr:ankyrin repeat domain-containing protein [Deltaproteobacteria bacterium]